MRFLREHFLGLITLSILLIALPFLVKLVQLTQEYLTQALGRPAKIVVDTKVILGPLPQPWLALAQGGEEKTPFSPQIIPQIRALQPKYIRLDHIYDFYNVVERKNGQLTFNWNELDKLVNQILETGALPFFSLSYMPPVIAQNGDLLAPPVNWNDWSLVVQRTIQHYSGRQEKNLTNVAYEVWNEPDLFGNWRIGGSKDYRLLYQYAVVGANKAQDTNSFKIGGPGITAPYKVWLDDFLDFIIKNRLRIDFYSWHRYSSNPEVFLDDINKIDTWLFQNAGYTLEKYLTEWGSDSQNSSFHDNNFDAAHLVAAVRKILRRVDLAFIFEIKDGPSPEGKKYWGRWGLLTHEAAGPVDKKPKYYALGLLNKLAGKQIDLQGEGTWVTGFAAQDGQEIKIILTNLDKDNRHFENVPITINNLENGNYTYQETFLSGVRKISNQTIINGSLQKEVLLSPNNIVVVELKKI